MNKTINSINYTYKHRSSYCQSSAPLWKRSTVQGQTITGNCCTHVIGWTRWWLTHIWCGNRFRSSVWFAQFLSVMAGHGHACLPLTYHPALRARLCIVFDKRHCQRLIHGYILTKNGWNSLKYIISYEGLYYFSFNIRFIVIFWLWCKI